MKTTKVTSLLTMTAAIAFAGLASAQEVTIKFGHLNNTDHPISMGVKKFAEIVAAKSGGRIKVQAMMGMVRDGTLQLGHDWA